MGCTVYLPFNKWLICMVNVGEYTVHLYVARTFYIFNLLLVSLFLGGGGALGFRWKSTICRFFAGGGGGVQGKQSCMMPYTQTNCAMKHGPHFSSAWKWEILNIANVACRDLKNLIFFEISKRWTHLNVLRGQFSGPLPRIWDPQTITGMVGLFSPLILGPNPNPEFYPGLGFPGWNSGFCKDIF